MTYSSLRLASKLASRMAHEDYLSGGDESFEVRETDTKRPARVTTVTYDFGW